MTSPSKLIVICLSVRDALGFHVRSRWPMFHFMMNPSEH